MAIRVGLVKGRRWPRPWIETPTHWLTCASAPDLQQSIRLATSDIVALLAERLSIRREEAFMLVGTAGDARPGQASVPGMDTTARVGVPRIL